MEVEARNSFKPVFSRRTVGDWTKKSNLEKQDRLVNYVINQFDGDFPLVARNPTTSLDCFPIWLNQAGASNCVGERADRL